MKFGCFGGSFDPVHFGHLVLAETCLDHAGLDHLSFIVAAAPPHKRNRVLATPGDRIEMCRLAVAGNPRLSVDDREHHREGISFTVDTVREILAEGEPGDEFHWIIGADTLPELPTWREATALLDLVPFLTAVRPGYDVERDLEGLRDEFGAERVERLREGIVPIPLMGISSTGIRQRVREGRSIRYLVPEAVREHLEEHEIY